MRNVMIVVPVLMNNCQVLEKLNMGPVTNQTKMINSAPKKAAAVPAAVEILEAIRLNISCMILQTNLS